MPRKNAVVDRTRCVACGECAYVCPKGAVSVEKGCYALVDTSICVGCGICSRSCPAGCITVEERKEAL